MNHAIFDHDDLIMRLPPDAMELADAVLGDRNIAVTPDWEEFLIRRVERVPDFSFDPAGGSTGEDALLWQYDLVRDCARLNSNLFSWGTPEIVYAVLDRLVIHRHVHLQYQTLALASECDSLYPLEREFCGQEGPEMVTHLRDLLDSALVPWSMVTAWLQDKVMHFHWADPCRLFLWKSHIVADGRCFSQVGGGSHA